jgi:hypothetical protein
MGQYYKVIVRKDGKDTIYDRKVEGNDGYTLAKLTEFCWCGNSFCRSLAQTLLDSPGKVCFVGDYAKKEECEALGFDYDAVWGEDAKCSKSPAELLDLAKVAYLVNGDKRQYVSLGKYLADSTDGDGWALFPLGILTALGNGRGGGDYHKEDPLVGSWAFDSVYFTNSAPPGDYEEIRPVFIDN